MGDAPFMTREETSKYSDKLADGRIRQFSFVMDARSVITSPTAADTMERGWHEIRGIAWSGRGKINGVEISIDGGKSWEAARLQGPVLPKAHTRFTLPFFWTGTTTEIQSRAIDETGYVQPTLKQLKQVRASDGIPYHFNPVTGWHIASDGKVLFTETG